LIRFLRPSCLPFQRRFWPI